MSRKTKPELDAPDDEAVELDEQTDDVDDLDDADLDDADADPAPAKRASKDSKSKDSGSKDSGSKNGTTKRGAKKSRSTSGRGSGKSGASKSALVSGGKRPGKGGKAPRAIKPVRVSSEKPWGTIALFGVVAVLFVSIVGYTSYLAWYSAKSPAERANMISGVTDYSEKVGKAGQHPEGDLKYDMSPPVGGPHNAVWQ
ncbi:MAG: hypothetical protein ACRDUA_12085, partial [Micromonosporaceae bacterium]